MSETDLRYPGSGQSFLQQRLFVFVYDEKDLLSVSIASKSEMAELFRRSVSSIQFDIQTSQFAIYRDFHSRCTYHVTDVKLTAYSYLVANAVKVIPSHFPKYRSLILDN